MTSEYEHLFRGVGHGRVSLPSLLTAPRLRAQTPGPPIRVRGINHVTLSVSDVKRSVDFS